MYGLLILFFFKQQKKNEAKASTENDEHTTEETDSCLDEVLKAQSNHFKVTSPLVGYPKYDLLFLFLYLIFD